ncbi:hypothetical protein [Sphingobium sufflavum]|uniref:hypothetical protein n=1 Tax=Sphingobium sufflavum TaxID=1129547 RepID=UPI002DD4218B|nr:hypothetical protein [Sphingobium sufflavum]
MSHELRTPLNAILGYRRGRVHRRRHQRRCQRLYDQAHKPADPARPHGAASELRAVIDTLDNEKALAESKLTEQRLEIFRQIGDDGRQRATRP